MCLIDFLTMFPKAVGTRVRWKIASVTAGHCGRLHLNVKHFKISQLGRGGEDLITRFEEDSISSVDKFFNGFV